MKANFLGWRPDRRSFLFSTNARNEKFFDIFQASLPDLTPKLIFQDNVGLDFADMSRNGRFVAFTKPGKATSDSDVYVYNTENKEVKTSPRTRVTSKIPPRFSISRRAICSSFPTPARNLPTSRAMI